MIIKTKCCFLKKEVDAKILEQYGFETLNDGHSYWLDLSIDNEKEFDYLMIGFYKDTRRFVLKYPKITSYKKVKPYIRKLFVDNLIEIKPMYEWLAIVGSYRNYSEAKRAKIEAKLNKLNEVVLIDCDLAFEMVYGSYCEEGIEEW